MTSLTLGFDDLESEDSHNAHEDGVGFVTGSIRQSSIAGEGSLVHRYKIIHSDLVGYP